MNSVHEQCPNSDLNSAQNSALHQAACPMSRPQRTSRHRFPSLTEQGRSRPQMMSRPQVQQARSRRQSMSRPPGRQAYVETSSSCRDVNSLQARSRRQFHVATSWTTSLCRDIKFMSRRQFPTSQVTTSVPCRDLLETNLCRDIVSMSRPPTLSPMSRHQIHVATSTSTQPHL